MPITGPSSYISTMNEFISHWAEADAAAPGGAAIVLVGGFAQSYLVSLRGGLQEARDLVTDMGVDAAIAREQLAALAAGLQARLVEFNARVRSDFPGSAVARSLPEAFSAGDSEGVVADALRKMSRLWAKVDAISPAPAGVSLPMVLMSSYDRASFDTERAGVHPAYDALSDAEVALRVAREERNDFQDRIYPLLKAYRAKLPTVFPEGHALLDSMPRLTPAPGHTPDAVAATAVWDVPATKAKVTWAASAEADIARYEVRGAPGADYTTEDEETLATVQPGDAREVLTSFALTAPGLTAGFKVYVVLNTGNERGSNPVYVTRPG